MWPTTEHVAMNFYAKWWRFITCFQATTESERCDSRWHNFFKQMPDLSSPGDQQKPHLRTAPYQIIQGLLGLSTRLLKMLDVVCMSAHVIRLSIQRGNLYCLDLYKSKSQLLSQYFHVIVSWPCTCSPRGAPSISDISENIGKGVWRLQPCVCKNKC